MKQDQRARRARIAARRLRAARTESGACTQCAATVESGFRLCAKHLERARLRSRARLVRIYERGLCEACKNPRLPDARKCRHHVLSSASRGVTGDDSMIEFLGQLIDSQGRKCYLCGDDIALGRNAYVEHPLPKSRYPDLIQDRSNIRWACKMCNKSKCDMTVSEYVSHCKRVSEIGVAEQALNASGSFGAA